MNRTKKGRGLDAGLSFGRTGEMEEANKKIAIKLDLRERKKEV